MMLIIEANHHSSSSKNPIYNSIHGRKQTKTSGFSFLMNLHHQQPSDVKETFANRNKDRQKTQKESERIHNFPHRLIKPVFFALHRLEINVKQRSQEASIIHCIYRVQTFVHCFADC